MKVKVIPNSPVTKISTKRFRADIDLVIELNAPAEDGKANLELIKFMRSYFGRDVKIVSGFKSRIKEVVVLT